MTETRRPPAWAEAILRVSLERADRESVSGDLLEAYRDSIVPERGEAAADIWYVRQVAGYLWRATFIWALLFSGAFVARTAYDWFVPTTDFYARSAFTTYFAAGVWFLAGAWAAWRSGSFFAGPVVTAVTTLVAALFSVTGASVLLAIWHDPGTLDAAAGSGGLGEVYSLPFMAIVPALVIGTVAGAVGSVGSLLWRRPSGLRSQG